jgi:stress responsive alpha/beta barrel protein
MIFHIVLFDFKSETTQEEKDTALEHVRKLQGKIPGIAYVHAGKSITSNKSFSHGFVMGFTDETVWRSYAAHPAHQPISQELQRVCSRIIDFDLPYEEANQ